MAGLCTLCTCDSCGHFDAGNCPLKRFWTPRTKEYLSSGYEFRHRFDASVGCLTGETRSAAVAFSRFAYKCLDGTGFPGILLPDEGMFITVSYDATFKLRDMQVKFSSLSILMSPGSITLH